MKTLKLNQNLLKIQLFLLKKKKLLQNYYNPNVKLLEVLFLMPKIKLKMEKKPTPNQLLYYKKSKLLMDLMLESKNSFNKPLIAWLLITKKKPAQIQNLLKIIQIELKTTIKSAQMPSVDNQVIFMMPKMPSTMKLMTNQKTYLPKSTNLLTNNN